MELVNPSLASSRHPCWVGGDSRTEIPQLVATVSLQTGLIGAFQFFA